jgi:hypothetical protein
MFAQFNLFQVREVIIIVKMQGDELVSLTYPSTTATILEVG